MKTFKRNITSALLILILLLSAFIPSISSYAVESVAPYATTYSNASYPSEYSTEYNSGTRNVVCTTLDGTSAESYYQDYAYDDLSAMSASALFTELQTLMRETHTDKSSYDDCHYKADRTDCQNEDGSISLIYTSYSATMSEWNGWNREHVWPQSLGGNTTTGGGADLHHIRPSDAGVNSSRGNKKYGESGSGATEKYGTNPAVGVLGGTYNSTYFEPLDNVKGDVARICLYVYVRWNSDWGAESVTEVFESVDILLEWCELDPVDTWEMGRNEVVGAIQGNRNVFIDYPEYAWLLFGREVPDDMATPSGEASGGTVSGGGSSGGESGEGGSTDGGSDNDDVVVGSTTTTGTTIADYADANSWANSTKYSSIPLDSNITVTASGGSNTGKYYTSGENWRLYQSESATVTFTASNGCTISSVKITYTSDSSGVLTLNGSNITSGTTVSVNSGTVTFGVGNTGSATNGQVRITAIEVVYASSTSCEHTNQTTTTKDATCTATGSITVTCDDCGVTISTTSIPATGHQNTTTTVVNATCTEDGSTTISCNDCGATVSTQAISATGHSYTDGVCEVCGNTQSVASTTTVGITIADYADANSWANSTKYSSITLDDNITITASGGSNTGKYYTSGEDWRLYQSESASVTFTANNGCTISSVKVTYTISNTGVLTLNGSNITSGTTVSVNSGTVTFGVGNTGSATNGQVRITAIEVVYASSTSCEHTNTSTATVPATCTATGSITVTCDDCGVTVSSEAIEALGHNLVDGVCTRCGYIENTSSEPTESGWILVTDASTLKAGDKIVIVSGTFAAGSISSSIMASVDGVVTADNIITTLPDGAVILTLGGSSGAWTLTNDSGKLLGATAVKKVAWGSGTTTWSISISDGLATIQNSTSSYGRFLYNVSSPRFTTYTSNTSASMLLPSIYRYEEASSGDAGETKIAASSMTIGSTLAMNYYISGYDASSDYYMVFTMNGVEYECRDAVEKNGRLVFSFTNIPPQYMGDNIHAALYCDGNETPLGIIESHSVKAYVEKVIELHGSNEELMNLVVDMLRYGAAAQMYVNYRTDSLVTDSLDTNGLDISTFGNTAVPTEDDNQRTMYPIADISALADSFTAVGVRFDFDNKIYLKFKTDDISKIKITVDDMEVPILDLEVSGGVYVYYTEGISATGFDEVFTFKMYVNGALHQTVTYSVNSYIYAKCGDLNTADESALTPLAQLVRALYRYGLSAKAYAQ